MKWNSKPKAMIGGAEPGSFAYNFTQTMAIPRWAILLIVVFIVVLLLWAFIGPMIFKSSSDTTSADNYINYDEVVDVSRGKTVEGLLVADNTGRGEIAGEGRAKPTGSHAVLVDQLAA